MSLGESLPVSVIMVGIGGYGFYYLKTLLEEFPPGVVRLVGVADPLAGKSGHFDELRRRKVPIFHSLEELYREGLNADLTVISSPIHLHVPHSCLALESGSNVLCDKPLGIVVQDYEELLTSRKKSGKWIMIGFQWSYSSAIQALKRDIQKGLFGKPSRLRTLIFWPRETSYYERNDWAGRQRDECGRWILDSPAANAMAHYLHNLFYILGDDVGSSARPKVVSAEAFRAYRIENFDSVACRTITEGGAELLFYASHTTLENVEPIFNLEFEGAEISFREFSDEIIAVDRQGRQISYGSPDDEHQFRKLFDAVDNIHNPKTLVCGPEAAFSHLLCVNGIQESADIRSFPESMIQRELNPERLWISGLDDAFYNCYKRGVLPSEAGYEWAGPGKLIDLTSYRYFPGGKPPKD